MKQSFMRMNGYSDNDENRSALGTYLRLLRTQKGLKLSDLTAELGIPTSSMSSIEKGRAMPTFSRLHALSAFFNVSTSDILNTCFKDTECANPFKDQNYSKTEKHITKAVAVNIEKPNLKVEDLSAEDIDDEVLTEVAKHFVSLENYLFSIKNELKEIRITMQSLAEVAKVFSKSGRP